MNTQKLITECMWFIFSAHSYWNDVKVCVCVDVLIWHNPTQKFLSVSWYLVDIPDRKLSSEEEEARRIAEMGKPVLGEHAKIEIIIEESYEFKVHTHGKTSSLLHYGRIFIIYILIIHVFCGGCVFLL